MGAAKPSALKMPRTAYSDFVVGMRRLNSQHVGVKVDASPAGLLTDEIEIVFSTKECCAMREGFLSIIKHGEFKGGRAQISAEEAARIGDRLVQVMFPPAVFNLFAMSLASLSKAAGLRLRLAMDPELLDLPWEYISRPDRNADGSCHMSNFLLLDPSISMVRHAADNRRTLSPIAGSQRLAFVGTFWEGGRDGWEVGKEFALLNEALHPVSAYLRSDFISAKSGRGISAESLADVAVFHYGGHADFDATGRSYLLKELPMSRAPEEQDKLYLEELAPLLGAAGTRLVVLSACNSGFSAIANTLTEAGVPVVLGINGGVLSASTILFCGKLYESLAVGLSLDEAVCRARLYLFDIGSFYGLFDWGLFMVHMTCPDAVVFPRLATSDLGQRQRSVRESHAQAIGASLDRARQMDGLNFGEIMSELTRRRVLILGRFSEQRLAVLEAIKEYLKNHENGYLPELFTFEKPESRDLRESAIGFAALSRFVIADLSEPRSVLVEIADITRVFDSLPIVFLLKSGGSPVDLFNNLTARRNVVESTIRYDSIDELILKLGSEAVPLAESKLREVRPPC